MEGIHLCLVNFLEKSIQAGLEAVFPVPMPGDSGLSPGAGSISNYCLIQEIFHSNPNGILWNNLEKVYKA